MNPVVIIPTYISTKRSHTTSKGVISNYDHTTDINEVGQLSNCLKSLECVSHLGLVIILVASQGDIEQEAVDKVRAIADACPEISTMVVGNSEVEMLKKRLEQLGHKDICSKIVLKGYSNIKNTGLIFAQAFGFDAAVFIDDDEIVDDPDFLKKAVYGLGKLTKTGVPILVKSGYYLNGEGSYLSSWQDKWYNRFWQQGSAFNEWISGAMAGPRLTRSNHVCGGCLAIHKEAFSRMSFDPYIPRGEDLDYMLNLRMHGCDIWFDNEMSLKHLPPKTKSEGKRFRQDIYRWLYEQAKLEFSWSLIDLQKVNAASLMPYPGILLGKGLKNRIWFTALLRSFGRPDKKAYRAAARSAKKDAVTYAERNCTKYFEFQKVWPEVMDKIDGDKVLSHQVLTSTSAPQKSNLNPGLTSEIQMNLG